MAPVSAESRHEAKQIFITLSGRARHERAIVVHATTVPNLAAKDFSKEACANVPFRDRPQVTAAYPASPATV
jgi:hypothetical protein